MLPNGFDPKQAKVVAQWKHDRPFVSCRIDPQGRYVFCGAEDAGVHRFQLDDGKKTTLSGGHDTWVRALAFTPDGETLVTGASDGRLAWWPASAEQPKPARVLDAHQGWIRALAVSPDGKFLASAGNDLKVKIWDLASGEQAGELSGHEKHVYSVLYHPSGEFILSGDLKGELRQWEAKTGKLVRTFDAKALHSYNGGQRVDFGGVRSIAVSPDAKHVAAGGLHKASNPLGAVHEPLVVLFDWQTQKTVRSHIAEGITKGVLWRLAYLADGSLLGACGGGDGGYLLFWKSDNDKDYFRFKLPNLTRDMDVHPDNIRVATVHYDRHVRITQLGG